MQHFIQSGIRADIFRTIAKLPSYPQFSGVSLDLEWSTLEPDLDVLKLRFLDRVLNELRKISGKLWLRFTYKRFNAAADSPMPLAGWSSPLLEPYVYHSDDDTAPMHVPEVRDAYCRTLERIRLLYDHDQVLDIIETPESAEGPQIGSFAVEGFPPYATVLQFEALAAVYSGLGRFEYTHGSANINWFPKLYLKELIAAAQSQGLAMTVTDVIDTDATKARPPDMDIMAVVSSFTYREQKSLLAIAAWLKGKPVHATSWYDGMDPKGPFAFATVADFVRTTKW